MVKKYIAGAVIVLAAGCLAIDGAWAQANWGQTRTAGLEQLRQGFEQPDMIYAPFMFWFWDAPLDAKQAADMAEEMCRQGMSPGYAHPRNGLPREQWLSPKWFDSLDAALKKAEAAKAYLGYCDEYWWPSGRADGRVLAAEPNLKAESLKWLVLNVDGAAEVNVPECLFAVAAEMEGDKIKSKSLTIVEKGRVWKAPNGKWRIYVFEKYHHAGIDGGDVNYLNRRLMKVFIDIAHEPYAKYFGQRMGKSMPGVFVDNEGDYGYKMAWSDDFASEYEKTRGRDIRVWMPLLIDEDIEGVWPKARWDWYDVVSDVYADNFLGSISRWLEGHGMYCTSHVWEEGLLLQAGAVGDFFKVQRAVSLPGNDCLVEKALQAHDFKETQSVCEFEGRRFQSEILGVAGWQMSPVLMKQAVNAITAWGVSHIVPHGIYMNRRLNTIPYPPDWYTSNPYWRYLRLWTDFARRASYVNSHGHYVPDVLLVNPMDSVCALLGDEFFDINKPGESETSAGSHRRTIAQIDKVYAKAINELTDARIEYLIADRHYIRQMKVKDGILVREPFEFKTVVLPSMTALPLDVAGRLVEFAEAGGYAYLLGDLPSASTDNGLNDPCMVGLMQRLRAGTNVRTAADGVKALVSGGAHGVQPQVRFESGEFAMHTLHRRIDGRDFFWLVNNTDNMQECTLVFAGARGLAQVWDCETGRVKDLPSEQAEGGSRVQATLTPYQAYWVVFDPAKEPARPVAEQGEWSIMAVLDGPWQIRIDVSAQPVAVSSEPSAPEELLTEEGVKRPLAKWSQWDLSRFTGFVDYVTTFESDVKEGLVRMELGEVKHTVEVWVNGESAGSRLWPPYEFDVGRYVHKGSNTVKVRVGNLLLNAMTQFVRKKDIDHNVLGWSKQPPDKDAGLLGPVVVRRLRNTSDKPG